MAKKSIKKMGNDYFKPRPSKGAAIIKTLKPSPKKSAKHVKKTNETIAKNIKEAMKTNGPTLMKKAISQYDADPHIREGESTWRFYSYMYGFENYYLPSLELIGKLIPVFVKKNRKQDAKRLFILFNNYWHPRFEHFLDLFQPYTLFPHESDLVIKLKEMYTALFTTFQNEYRHLTGEDIPETSPAALHNYFKKHYPKVGKELLRLKEVHAKWFGKSPEKFVPFEGSIGHK